jgi:hypothetical protein
MVGLAVAVATVVILRAGRGTNFFFDEWEWITRRRDASLDDFLRPHNGHFSAIPVGVYKVLFELFGIRSYTPYRVVVLVAHLVCCTLLFVYLRRRVSDWYSVSATVVLLFLGYAWQDLLWAFQIGYFIAAAAGLVALLLVDRRDRAGDVGVVIALVVSIACAGVGLVFLGGVAIELLWRRTDWRRAWIALVPVVLYGIWYLGYGSSNGRVDNLGNAPAFAGDAAGSATGALFGVSLGPGRVFAIALAAIVGIVVVRAWPISGRFAATIAMPLAFWGLLAYTRGDGYGSGADSRYVYIGGLLVLLLGAELLRSVGSARCSSAWLGVGAVALLAVVAHSVWLNLDALNEGARGLRHSATSDKATYGALVLAGDNAASDVFVTLGAVRSGELLDAFADLGAPVFSRSDLARSRPWLEAKADDELLRLLGGTLRRDEPARRVVDAIPVARVDHAQVQTDGGCATVTPDASAGDASIELRADALAVRIHAPDDAPVSVSGRVFADAWNEPPIGEVPAGGTAILDLRSSRAGPWQVKIASSGVARVCALAE